MFHKISSKHFIFRSDAFQKDAVAFNLMTTILADTSRYPDTKCFSDEKNCILVNTDNQHPIIIWTSDDFNDFEALYQFIEAEFKDNQPLSFIAKKTLFDFYKTKYGNRLENIETMGVYQYNVPIPIQYIGYADNIKPEEIQTIAEMMYQFYHESHADNHKSLEDCIPEAKKFMTEPNYKVWRQPNGKLVALARYHLSEEINRIGLVYTRPDERGKSYAKMLVHTLTQQILNEQKIPVLYTDFDYEPSNKCYTAIGYRLTNQIVSFSIKK